VVKSEKEALDIKSWRTDDVPFSCEVAEAVGESLRLKSVVEAAIRAGTKLTYADLAGANLAYADLTDIRDDLFSVLSACPGEVAGLRGKILSGEIDGSCYEGACCCLVGTIGKLRRCSYDEIPGVSPNSARPIERFFLAIKPGHTPDNNPIARMVVRWIDEWVAERAEEQEVTGG
jgi:hypothetical protein